MDEPALVAAATMSSENVAAAKRVMMSKCIIQEQPFRVTLRITRNGKNTAVPTHFPDDFAVYRGGCLETKYAHKTDARFWCENKQLVVTKFQELPQLADVMCQVEAFKRERWEEYADDGPTSWHAQFARPMVLALPSMGDISEIALEAECAPTVLEKDDVLHVHVQRQRDTLGALSEAYPMRAICAGVLHDFDARTTLLRELAETVRRNGPTGSVHVSTTTPLLRGTLLTVCTDPPTDGVPMLQDVGFVRVGEKLAISTVIVRFKFRRNAEEDCAICFSRVTTRGWQCTTCLHVCHAICINKWHQLSPLSRACPCCRAQISS